MAFGLLESGFILKRLQDIKSEIETAFRDIFGNGINLEPTEFLGQHIGTFSEREALIWEILQDLYNIFSPSNASGVALDNIVEITAIKRLKATKGTGSGIAYGTLNTLIPSGSILSVDGNPDARFLTTEDNIIGAGTDEIQDIDFSSVPDAGSWSLIFDGEATGSLAFNDNAAAIQAALNGLPNLSAVSVAGDYSLGFTVTFTGADGEKDQLLIQVGTNTLTDSGAQVNITIVETTKGILPNVTCALIAETAGFIQANSGSLTVIETPVAGWDSFTNPLDIDAGNDIETDSELRLRRNNTLAAPGSATVDGIRAALLELDTVEAAIVFQNITDVTDIDGRPPHSVAPVVLGGDDAVIAQILFDNVAAGINFFGSITEQVIDSQGFSQQVKFSRPTQIDIYLEIDIVKDVDFPVGGENSIKTSVVTFGENTFLISDDVITTKLYEPIHDTIGILDVTLRIATSNIQLVQVLTFDADFVAGNTIDLDLAGTAITQVPFNVNHATTLSDLATEIQANALVVTASVTGAREITVTSQTAGIPAPISNVIVAGGVSQAGSEVETTSHSDDNISIDVDEISSWDTSRIVVTDIT